MLSFDMRELCGAGPSATIQTSPESFAGDVLAIAVDHLPVALGEPLFFIGALAPDSDELVALDASGSVVVVAAVRRLTGARLMAALSTAGYVAHLPNQQIAERYPRGLEAFGHDVDAFFDAAPRTTAPAPADSGRLVLLCSEVDDEASDALGFLAAAAQIRTLRLPGTAVAEAPAGQPGVAVPAVPAAGVYDHDVPAQPPVLGTPGLVEAAPVSWLPTALPTPSFVDEPEHAPAAVSPWAAPAAVAPAAARSVFAAPVPAAPVAEVPVAAVPVAAVPAVPALVKPILAVPVPAAGPVVTAAPASVADLVDVDPERAAQSPAGSPSGPRFASTPTFRASTSSASPSSFGAEAGLEPMLVSVGAPERPAGAVASAFGTISAPRPSTLDTGRLAERPAPSPQMEIPLLPQEDVTGTLQSTLEALNAFEEFIAHHVFSSPVGFPAQTAITPLPSFDELAFRSPQDAAPASGAVGSNWLMLGDGASTPPAGSAWTPPGTTPARPSVLPLSGPLLRASAPAGPLDESALVPDDLSDLFPGAAPSSAGVPSPVPGAEAPVWSAPPADTPQWQETTILDPVRAEFPVYSEPPHDLVPAGSPTPDPLAELRERLAGEALAFAPAQPIVAAPADGQGPRTYVPTFVDLPAELASLPSRPADTALVIDAPPLPSLDLQRPAQSMPSTTGPVDPALAALARDLTEPLDLVWVRHRRGERFELSLHPDGTLHGSNGARYSDPSWAANVVSGGSTTDGWRVWRAGDDGPSLADLQTGQLSAQP